MDLQTQCSDQQAVSGFEPLVAPWIELLTFYNIWLQNFTKAVSNKSIFFSHLWMFCPRKEQIRSGSFAE